MFNCQQIWQINHISGRSTHGKNVVVNAAVQRRSYVMWISKNFKKYWRFVVFTLNTTIVRQINKTGQWQLPKSFLGLASILRNSIYIKCTKWASSNSPNCFATFGFSACQASLSWHVELPDNFAQMSKN